MKPVVKKCRWAGEWSPERVEETNHTWFLPHFLEPGPAVLEGFRKKVGRLAGPKFQVKFFPDILDLYVVQV
jgi:hypothetical protein